MPSQMLLYPPPPCEICGISGHIGVDYQLGSALNGIEQVNYAQYAQRMRQNQSIKLRYIE